MTQRHLNSSTCFQILKEQDHNYESHEIYIYIYIQKNHDNFS
jgi:hypothetical protein